MNIAGRKVAPRASEEEKAARLLRNERRQKDVAPRTFSAAERREIQDHVRAFYNLLSVKHADLRSATTPDEFEDTLLDIEEDTAQFVQDLYTARKP